MRKKNDWKREKERKSREIKKEKKQGRKRLDDEYTISNLVKDEAI